MYSLLVKKVGEPSYKSIKNFRTYKKAYYFVGNKLQTKHNLHFSYSIKYLMCGYDRKKIFPLGKTFVRRDNICYKIVQQ
jgi:hypothetical protein